MFSINLAAAAEKAVYIDCDIEEPNGRLFWKPENIITKNVKIPIPLVDQTKCNGCRTCIDFCKYNALAYIGGKIKVFENICHSCGGCVLLCPENAISEKDRVIGKTEKGISGNVTVITGTMNTGEASGVPIIRELRSELEATGGSFVFIDCPPGSACTVMESIKDSDYCLLIAEPTIFGTHNLAMAHKLVKIFKKPHGVILNKCLENENPSEDFCRKNNVPIIGRMAFDEELGEINSNAHIAVRKNEKYRDVFSRLLNTIQREALQ